MKITRVTDIKVYVGKAGPFLYACIRYETEVNIALIVGLSVGLGVPLILLIIIVVVCICKRREKGKQRTDDDSRDLEMTPVVVEHCPTDAHHVER